MSIATQLARLRTWLNALEARLEGQAARVEALEARLGRSPAPTVRLTHTCLGLPRVWGGDAAYELVMSKAIPAGSRVVVTTPQGTYPGVSVYCHAEAALGVDRFVVIVVYER